MKYVGGLRAINHATRHPYFSHFSLFLEHCNAGCPNKFGMESFLKENFVELKGDHCFARI